MKKVCIMGEMRKDREKGLPNDVDGLIDHYRHEVRKGQEAYDELLKEVNMLRGTKQVVERLSAEFKKMKKRAQEAETETILVKGIGINSPEMKSLKAEVEALKQQLHVDSEKYKERIMIYIIGLRTHLRSMSHIKNLTENCKKD